MKIIIDFHGHHNAAYFGMKDDEKIGEVLSAYGKRYTNGKNFTNILHDINGNKVATIEVTKGEQ